LNATTHRINIERHFKRNTAVGALENQFIFLFVTMTAFFDDNFDGGLQPLAAFGSLWQQHRRQMQLLEEQRERVQDMLCVRVVTSVEALPSTASSLVAAGKKAERPPATAAS
jgi:hypothetical protein